MDMPSPVADSNNVESLPHKCTRLTLKTKRVPTEPDEFEERPYFDQPLLITLPRLHKKKKKPDNFLE